MKDFKDRLTAKGVHTLIAQFTDIHGVAKGKLVPLVNADALLADGVGFSGPSIWGTGLPRTGRRADRNRCGAKRHQHEPSQHCFPLFVFFRSQMRGG